MALEAPLHRALASLAVAARDLEEAARVASTDAAAAYLIALARKASAAASSVSEILEGLKSQPSPLSSPRPAPRGCGE